MTTPEPLPQSELERIKALCEKPKDIANAWSVNLDAIEKVLVALPKCVAEIERLNKQVDNIQTEIAELSERKMRQAIEQSTSIKRLQTELAEAKDLKTEFASTYRIEIDRLKSITTETTVAALQKYNERLCTELAEAREDKELLDWLLNALMEPGQILNQFGWTDGRQAIRAAMKATPQ